MATAIAMATVIAIVIVLIMNVTKKTKSNNGNRSNKSKNVCLADHVGDLSRTFQLTLCENAILPYTRSPTRPALVPLIAIPAPRKLRTLRPSTSKA